MALSPIDATGTDVIVLQSGWSLLFFEQDGATGLLESSEQSGAVGPIARFTLELDDVASTTPNNNLLRANQSFVLRSVADRTHTLNWRVASNKLVVSAAAEVVDGDVPLHLQISANDNTPPGSEAVWYGVSYEMPLTTTMTMMPAAADAGAPRMSEDFDFQLGVAERGSLLSTKYRFRLLTVGQYKEETKEETKDDGGSASGLSTTAIIVLVLSIVIPLLILAAILYWKHRRRRSQQPQRLPLAGGGE